MHALRAFACCAACSPSTWANRHISRSHPRTAAAVTITLEAQKLLRAPWAGSPRYACASGAHRIPTAIVSAADRASRGRRSPKSAARGLPCAAAKSTAMPTPSRFWRINPTTTNALGSPPSRTRARPARAVPTGDGDRRPYRPRPPSGSTLRRKLPPFYLIRANGLQPAQQWTTSEAPPPPHTVTIVRACVRRAGQAGGQLAVGEEHEGARR